MSSMEEFRQAADRWEISLPSAPLRLPGSSMAGFRDRTTEPVDLKVVPFPSVTLFFDLTDGNLQVVDGDGQRPSGSVVLGLEPAPVRGGGQGMEILQVRLSPVVAYSMLGDCAQLGAGVVALEDLWDRDGSLLQDRLRDAASWDDRFAIAASTLGRRLESGWRVDPEVGHAWRQVRISNGQVRVEQLAADVGWSRKRLWSRFRSQIGLTPKRAAQLVRFDWAAHRLVAGQDAAAVAAAAGYFDQSHLHRDIRSFAGSTPSSVSREWWMAVDDVAWSPRSQLSRR